VIADRHHNAAPRVAWATPRPPTPKTTTLRGSMGEGSDADALRHLAALSQGPAPQGAVLLAEADGQPIAAIGIFDGRAVADPACSTIALRARLQLERLFLRLMVTVGAV
jgi:hypothetical protein